MPSISEMQKTVEKLEKKKAKIEKECKEKKAKITKQLVPRKKNLENALIRYNQARSVKKITRDVGEIAKSGYIAGETKKEAKKLVTKVKKAITKDLTKTTGKTLKSLKATPAFKDKLQEAIKKVNKTMEPAKLWYESVQLSKIKYPRGNDNPRKGTKQYAEALSIYNQLKK